MQQSLGSAARYLMEAQCPDGHWEDYALPVGFSDAWVTAYAGFALSEAADWSGEDRSGAARNAAGKAGAWLRDHRCSAAGWGFNGSTGPDADSTAWALRLFAALQIEIEDRDVQFLLARRRSDGGFATYEEPAFWGRSQPDVTAAVFVSLPRTIQRDLAESVLRYLAEVRSSDGTWPSYWWRTCHYATSQCLELFETIGRRDERVLPVVTDDEAHGIHSAFDLACVARIVTATGHKEHIANSVLRELIALQQENGAWPGAENLRVTEPNCPDPWNDPRGRLYTDTRGIISTATALRTLVYACARTEGAAA